ncbi:MAG: PASTA domain-containing protein [Nitrospirae bacterium]|nr:PASTA domain-containing protein [Nitrospirota bacterium]
MERFLKGLGLFIALIGVGILSAFAVVALLLRQEEVRMPDLTGQDIVNVIETVAQQGLQLKVDRREAHPTLPRDAVISQSPAPEVGIKKGRQVRVVVSQGPSDTQALKLVGENFRKADMMIRQAGFSPGTVSRVFSDRVERDMVIAQGPEAGNPLEKGSGISLLISAGNKAPLYVMPALTGKKAKEALRIIDRIGLQRRVITRPPGNEETGTDRIVIQQKPGAGSPVARDATVDIVVNR